MQLDCIVLEQDGKHLFVGSVGQPRPYCQCCGIHIDNVPPDERTTVTETSYPPQLSEAD